MKLKYLDKLADIVVAIDEAKNMTDANIVGLTDAGIGLIAEMRRMGLDVGNLQEVFVGMQLACGSPNMLPELIEIAHEEIVRLLAADAWRIYGFDEAVCFFEEPGTERRVAA